MPVNITNQYQDFSLPINQEFLHAITAELLRVTGYTAYSLSIILTDDRDITDLNARYRNKNQSTNVLSFPFLDGTEPGFEHLTHQELGDIFISLDTALREANEFNQTFIHRLSWLITHGFLHLIGYDHEISETEAERMFSKEQSLLEHLRQVRRKKMTHLAINVDHIATIRQARGITEPDPVAAAAICEFAGASGIVVHLREDRRHIQDRDVKLLRQTVKTKLNLEMGANKEIVKIALETKPDMVTLVPEKREELTTEGGLDVAAQKKKLSKVIEKFNSANIPVSLFIDPVSKQIKAAHDIGATFVEIHTGAYCDALSERERNNEFQQIAAAADEASMLGLRVNAGHGLDYYTTAPIAALDSIEELSIGHAVISRAVIVGLEKAVRDMKNIILDAASLR